MVGKRFFKQNTMIDEIKHLSQHKKNTFLKIIIWAVIIILLGLVGAGGYFFYQYQILKKQFGTQLVAQDEVKKYVAEVGKLMLLPGNETPTIATVTDITKLKNNAFFQKSKNGDKLLIYTNAREAILYDPQKHIIINVGPVTIGGQQPSQASQAKIGLRNGTNTQGVTYKVEADLQKAFPGANIVLKDQDKRTDYDKTIVVPLNDLAKNAASDLAKSLNATVVNLPSDETKPEGVDILVILGKDKS